MTTGGREVGEGLRPLDRELLGLEPDPDDPAALSLVVVPHLCRTDGRFYGGAALAAALAASEAATGRAALWSATQLVATADIGERVRVDVDVVASGRSVDQVLVRGTVGDRLVFTAVGSTATAHVDGMRGVGQVMPRVPPPDACEDWRGPRRHGAATPRPTEPPRVGHHLVSDLREAPLLDGDDPTRPGRMVLWARLTEPVAPSVPTTTPAVLGFLADLVPLAVAQACGVDGAGTSLDNSLRVGEPVDSEWVLLDVDAHVAVGGYGHGHVHLWSPDGRMLGTGSQSARLFSMADFFHRQVR